MYGSYHIWAISYGNILSVSLYKNIFWKSYRLEKIFVKSPAGIEIEVNHQGVQITRGGAMMPFIYFDQDRSTGLDDVHLEIESAASEYHRKNGVQIAMPSLNGIDEIEFHVSFKAKVETNNF